MMYWLPVEGAEECRGEELEDEVREKGRKNRTDELDKGRECERLAEGW